jgi:chromosome segregation ATPase
MINYNEELKTQRQLLEKELQILRERYNNNEKLKMDNEIIDTTSEKQYEHINKELAENNRKISILQNKIDDLISKIKKGEELLALENYDATSHSEFNQTLERRILTLKETLKLNENKLIMIKREVDNLKFYIDEGEGERILLNKKLEDLIKILTNINATNSKINTFLNFLVDSIGKKTRFMVNECNNLEKSTEMKNKILNFLKEINSYQDIVDNY